VVTVRLEVSHTTRYAYEAPVSQCLNELRLSPRETAVQRVLETGITVEPAPAFLHHRTDYFGNGVSVFAVLTRHEGLALTARSIVELQPAAWDIASTVTWEDARSALQAQEDDACLEASEFTYASPYVPLFAELAEFARKTFTPGRPLAAAALDLTHRICQEFRYDQKSTSIDSPLPLVLRKKRGVCQDFAHVAIGACRSLGLAARYVSGYVRSGGDYQGALASHAWLSVFVPATGWLDFDPTNDGMPSDGHVTLAYGRDYGDVTPVKGVTLGGGGQSVEVEVYVKPVG
jgi:transglutaminase-like putative cysteine protease